MFPLLSTTIEIFLFMLGSLSIPVAELGLLRAQLTNLQGIDCCESDDVMEQIDHVAKNVLAEHIREEIAVGREKLYQCTNVSCEWSFDDRVRTTLPYLSIDIGARCSLRSKLLTKMLQSINEPCLHCEDGILTTTRWFCMPAKLIIRTTSDWQTRSFSRHFLGPIDFGNLSYRLKGVVYCEPNSEEVKSMVITAEAPTVPDDVFILFLTLDRV